MTGIVKVIGTEFSLTMANTVGGSRLVRLLPASNALITRAYSNAVTAGTFTAPGGQVTWAAKKPSDTFASSVACNCAAVAFQS